MHLPFLRLIDFFVFAHVPLRLIGGYRICLFGRSLGFRWCWRFYLGRFSWGFLVGFGPLVFRSLRGCLRRFLFSIARVLLGFFIHLYLRFSFRRSRLRLILSGMGRCFDRAWGRRIFRR